MKKIGMLILTVFLVFGVGGNAMAERMGGTFNWIAPYGGDFHSLDPHISARTNDYLALINMNRGSTGGTRIPTSRLQNWRKRWEFPMMAWYTPTSSIKMSNSTMAAT